MCACTCTHTLSLSSQNCPLPHDILDRFTEKFYSSCQTHFVQNAKHLVQSFEESFSSQQVRMYVYMYVCTYTYVYYMHTCVCGWMDGYMMLNTLNDVICIAVHNYDFFMTVCILSLVLAD